MRSYRYLSLCTINPLVVVEPLAFTSNTLKYASHLNSPLASTTKSDETAKSAMMTAGDLDKRTRVTTLGLLTFDLDDTLYPIEPVIKEANDAFARAMDNFGYFGIKPGDIDATVRKIRAEMAESDRAAAVAMTQTDIRKLAIRREMENILLERRLNEIAKEYDMDLSSLSPIVVDNARSSSASAVSQSVVEAVNIAWEMERHHAAERHLFTEVIDVLERIKKEHPGVIIGAVTDGKADPLLMTFTLAPYFDFCMSWEDDQGTRSKFFKELGAVGGISDLTWIYDAAKEKYRTLSSTAAAVDAAVADDVEVGDGKGAIWIHVGDDLAYDVGGSAACGARTVLLELADKYGQTARHRFSSDGEKQPAWSTITVEDVENRKIMNDAAKEHVDATVNFLFELPDTINKILRDEDHEKEQ